MSRTLIALVSFAVLAAASIWLLWTAWARSGSVDSVSVAAPTTAPSGDPAVAITLVPAPLNSEGVPARLGALTLARTIKGTDALSEFAQMHGQGFDLVGGYRADYAGGTKAATLWVGQARDASAAQNMVETMAVKIGPDNEMFRELRGLKIGERMLFGAVGQGQQHFFFGTNDKVVWLAADPEQAPDALHSLWSAVK